MRIALAVAKLPTKSRRISVIVLMRAVTQKGRDLLVDDPLCPPGTQRPGGFFLHGMATIRTGKPLPCVLVGSRPLCRSGHTRPVSEDPGRVPIDNRSRSLCTCRAHNMIIAGRPFR